MELSQGRIFSAILSGCTFSSSKLNEAKVVKSSLGVMPFSDIFTEEIEGIYSKIFQRT
jgi:hypothetical protein